MIIKEQHDDGLRFAYDGKNSYVIRPTIQSNGMVTEMALKLENVFQYHIKYYEIYQKFNERVARHKKLEKLLC